MATLSVVGIEVARQAMAETSAILPLVGYFNTLRGVFVAPALAVIAVSINDRLDDWKRGRGESFFGGHPCRDEGIFALAAGSSICHRLRARSRRRPPRA